MKATDLLKEQHQEIDELFERISLAESGEMRALCGELAANLLGHSAIEREIFYPASREALGASFQLQTAFEEHALVEYALQKLLSTEPGDETFHARVDVLKELVQHHVEEEERELLKQAEGALGEERLEDLGAQMEARFEQVREGDIEAMLAAQVAQSMPAPARRGQEKRPRKAAAKRPPAKRGGAQREEPARGGAMKGRRGATTGRKKPSTPASAKTGRGAPARKTTPSRATPGRATPGRATPGRQAKTGRTGGRKGGRSGATSSR